MERITVKIDGMACGMCENHICDCIRRSFAVRKVTASCGRGQAVILADGELTEEALRAAIDPTGYRVLSVSREIVQEKKHFWNR